MSIFKDLIKEIIQEELADAMKEEVAALKAEQQTPAQPQQDGSNSVNDKTTTTTEDKPSQAAQTATATEDDAIDKEALRKLISKEVRATAADILNKQPAAQPKTNGRTEDEVFAALLGIDLTKGDK